MSHYFYIKRSWLISAQSRRLWRTCAWLSLMLLALIYLYAGYGEWLYQHQVLDQLGHLLLLISALAAAGTMIAMEYYIVTLDQSPALAQIFWFLIVFAAPVGPAIYCLLVYSRAKHFQIEAAESASTFSAKQS